MAELEGLLWKQLQEAQDFLRAQTRQSLGALGDLRRENEELRGLLQVETLRSFSEKKSGGEQSNPSCEPVLQQASGLPGEVETCADVGLKARMANRHTWCSGRSLAQRVSHATNRLSGSHKDALSSMSVMPIDPHLRESSEVDGHQVASRQSRATKPVFADAALMKERVRRAILKPEYHVSQYYKETGCCQWVARSSLFDNATLVVISLNAIWIAVDSDLNSAPVIFQADLVFQLAEQAFFWYFALEWLVRFLAFETKRDCLRDAWFVFDSMMVLLMVVDSWVMSVAIVLMGNVDTTSVSAFPAIRIVRLLRLLRMMRMARLLRAAPELMILIKGIAGATRSVGFTLLLLLGIIYIFAIAFRTLTADTALGEAHFPSVIKAAGTLLLDCTLPDPSNLVYAAAREHVLFAVLLVFFILLASLTVMNMLVGVLVEVVTTVSSVEKEQMEATFLKTHMLHFLRALDQNGDVRISKDEFAKLLEKPKAIKALQEVGVDVVGLAELSDFIYKDRVDLAFPDFMETVLQLRGTNTATVKSIVDVRMFMTKELARVEDNLLDKLQRILQQHANRGSANRSPPGIAA